MSENTIEDPPQFPAGEYVDPQTFNESIKKDLIHRLRQVPQRAQDLVAGLSDSQLDTKYRNWTIRQIIHHIVDSHINSYVRFKWALTESEPTIKAYDESLWNELNDATSAPLDSSLLLLDGLHQRWCEMVERLQPEELKRGFFHPELNKVVTLEDALPMYVWHSDHHLAQVEWVRAKHGF